MTSLFLQLERSWQEVLKEELNKPYFFQLNSILEKEYVEHTIYPPSYAIFNAFLKTPFTKVKVVILGQDPYHGPSQAHGLCFSVPHGITLPPSLKNIYKELKNDLGIEPATHGCLEKWAEQGVLLLNSILTVRAGAPLSHAHLGWERFTDQCIKKLWTEGERIIFVLWGKEAMEKCKHFPLSSSHLILQAAHPSPFSAHRGFLGCKHFSKINEVLTSQHRDPIEWRL